MLLSQKIDTAIDVVEQDVKNVSYSRDIEYFRYHKQRFRKLATSVSELLPQGGKILEVGGHYLQTASILSELNFDVESVDVSAFWEMDFVIQRSKDFEIKGITENNLQHFDLNKNLSGDYDLVIFTEILEHITFNPIRFWKCIYNQLADGGYIYITTPNAFSLPHLVRAQFNLLRMKSLGIKVDEIFSEVTYGHHWKEYSAKEIKYYFKCLSEDFDISINYFSYGTQKSTGFRNGIWNSLLYIGSITKFLASGLEAVVQKKSTDQGFNLKTPSY
ncbi:hypothetical protein BFP97_13515 [Roseivirga sp. 4D4]|uniref:class I SAM-dependent methyltransferase n=1 Tax=Roseivirga sp. 4D4 TaxID=1889784 RepID=UPI000852B139|nr:class I SAM-dependent methyltransferase [Roseivirga sp. 4D4]OEK02476.1 hypothetical protein BFP97_13515 [Roseivirga sp. 4D4]